jgi:VCBS repeat-containing protein
MLSPLAENGGNTWTHALLPGSPALNAIPGGNCPVTTDQRDVARPQFGACDIGAYENADSLPPFAAGDGYTTTEEVTLSVAAPGVLSNDNDANGDVITPTLQTNPTNGALVFNNDGSFVYTPTLDFAGIDSFTYMLTDGVLTDMAVVTISVTNVNDAPIALSDTYTATEDMLLTTVAPGVLSNDNDVDGDSLTAVLNTDVTSGTLSLNSDGSFTYTPDSDICGQDSFTYHANDSQADSNTVTVMIDVTCVNDAPLANDDSYNTTEDTMLNIAASGVLTNDTDVEGDGFTAVLDTSTLSGTLSLNGDGSFDYTPDADFCGTDSFTYHANDGQADSNIATATIGVSCVNDAPVAEDDMYSVPEDSINSALAVLVNDSDVDGDALSLTAVTMPSNGTAAISGTIILYSPNINFLGTDVFTYTVSDGMLTDTAVVTISVDNQNDAPTAVDDSYSVSEDSSNNVLDVLVNDSDIDVGDVLSVTAVFFPSNGTATISGTAVLYTPVPDFFGTDVFSYTVSDGALTDTAVVTVTVVNINDGPTAFADAYPVDENSSDNIFAVLANDSDVDGDSLSIVSVDGAGHGTAVISGTNILYTPNLDFVGIDTFTYTISDGNLTAMATITVTVMPLQTGVTIYLPFVTKP